MIPIFLSGSPTPEGCLTFSSHAVSKRASCEQIANSPRCLRNGIFGTNSMSFRAATLGPNGMNAFPASSTACGSGFTRKIDALAYMCRKCSLGRATKSGKIPDSASGHREIPPGTRPRSGRCRSGAMKKWRCAKGRNWAPKKALRLLKTSITETYAGMPPRLGQKDENE